MGPIQRQIPTIGTTSPLAGFSRALVSDHAMAPLTTALAADILEFDLDSILDYASTLHTRKHHQKIVEATPETDTGLYITMIDRRLFSTVASPVPLKAPIFDQYLEQGLLLSAPNTYRFCTDQFEARVLVSMDLPVVIVPRNISNKKWGSLLSFNFLDAELKRIVLTELYFITKQVRKCRNHFTVAKLLLSMEFRPHSDTITIGIAYKMDMHMLPHRYFSSDVSASLAKIIGAESDDFPIPRLLVAEKYAALPINTHLFFQVITDHTGQMPAAAEPLRHLRLQTTLLPFQRRTVQWLLARESIRYDGSSGECRQTPLVSEAFSDALRSFPDTDTEALDEQIYNVFSKLAFGWNRIIFRDEICWYNSYTGNLLPEAQAVKLMLSLKEENVSLPGCGLLCEEMGLGKTVEIASLILFNPRPAAEVGTDISLQLHEQGDFRYVKRAKTTLIAAPQTILNQWYKELSHLAPLLAVTIYKGMGKYPEFDNIPKYIAEYLRCYDVVLFNYSIMSRETDFAKYSSRHKPTRGGKKRADPDETAEATNGVAAFQAKFDFLGVADSDNSLKQRLFDRAVRDDIIEKIRREGTHNIPHLQYYESPLMLCQWWRVVLDEVQMVSSGSNKAFETAALLPRFHSWGVSGTPSHLLAVLQFLRLLPFSYEIGKSCWKRLNEAVFGNADFVRLWRSIAIRHTKAMVRDDIHLPPQQRILLTIPFTDVEQDKYSEILDAAFSQVGLSASKATPDSFASNSAHFKTWLMRLRQLCGNLQVGKLPRAKVTHGKRRTFLVTGVKELKTLSHVLDDMIRTVNDEIMEGEKLIINRILEVCLALEYVFYPEVVIELLTEVRKEIAALLADVSDTCELEVRNFNAIRDLLSKQDLLSKAEMELFETDFKEELEVKAEPEKELLSDEQIENALEEYLKLKELVTAMRARVRSWKVTQHKCYFLLGSAFFQLYDPEYQEKIDKNRIAFPALKDVSRNVLQGGLRGIEREFSGVKEENLPEYVPDASKSAEEQEADKNKFAETVYYGLAEECRQQILKHSITEVETTMKKRFSERGAIESGTWENDGSTKFPKSLKKTFMAIPAIEIAHLKEGVAHLKAKAFVDRFLELAAKLNRQAEVINENMSLLREVLTNPVVSAKESADGEEYEQSVSDQEKASFLMLVIAQMLMERLSVTLESRDALLETIKQQERELRQEASRAADRAFISQLQSRRASVKPQLDHALEELLQDCRFWLMEVLDQHHVAIEVFEDVVETMAVVVENEKTCQNLLKRELNLSFNALFNSRVEYFKQLQLISDSVRNNTLKFPQDSLNPDQLDLLFQSLFHNLSHAKSRLNKSVSRMRYLSTLVPNTQEATLEENDEFICIICQSPITIGSLTSCGHKFCRLCLEEWLIRNHSCPMCKTYTDRDTIYGFTQYKANLKAKHVDTGEEVTDKTSLNQIYKQLDESTLKKVQRVKLQNSYGSKVDLIVKQVLYLRSQNPEVQIVVFSQWQDLLVILAFAFDKSGITYVSAKGSAAAAGKYKNSDPVEEFKDTSSIKTCFLLNAQAQASGLTLINATHIFLCEPLIHTPTELQAISRIHRIGQTKVTTVWMFAIENTIEENIVALGARRRLEYFRANAKERHLAEPTDKNGVLQESELLAAESFALTLEAKSAARTLETVENDDLYAIFYGDTSSS